ncbi:MAG: hypothetical protein Q8935_24340, partial [Bacillota bacterium]|nr:hypothetical protein [Bacillota bacterium]
MVNSNKIRFQYRERFSFFAENSSIIWTYANFWEIKHKTGGTLFCSFHKLKGKGEEAKLIDLSPINLDGHTFLA